MAKSVYRTLTGRLLDLSGLNAEERKFLVKVRRKFRTNPGWTPFASFWLKEFFRANLPKDSLALYVCGDLEGRLGIAEGNVAFPDYTEYLEDFITEKFGSRYAFCKATGIDPGHLSRVLSGLSDVSLATLEKLLEALGAVLVLEDRDTVLARARPEAAVLNLAGVKA